jgi:cobalamin-dependent methionine synthase I
MATVQGDVHDIGKNIRRRRAPVQQYEVGSTSACMVPARNPRTGAQEKADIIGLPA